MATSGMQRNLVMAVLLASLVLAAGCKTSVTVPDVSGMTQTAAQATLTGAGFTLGAVTPSYSATVAAGAVVSQVPAPGTSAATGTPVALVVSQGPQPVGVPNVIGQTQAEAGAAFGNVGLAVGSVAQQCSNTVAAGLIISQNPTTGALMVPGSAVALVVSSGLCNETVPNVVGQTQAAASAAIGAAGLAVGVVAQAYSPTVPAGTVISQSSAAGTSIPHGSAVSLTVSKGPEPVAVPDIVGQTQAGASAALTGAGFAVGTVTEAYSPTVPSGSVISQLPAAGALAVPGSSVALTVSKGPEPVNVPDIAGLTRPEASAAITSALLSVGTVARMYHATVPADRVIDQNPVADTSVLPGTSVDFTISLGPEPAAGTVLTVMLPDDVPLEMVWIPTGSFLMGSANTEAGRDSDETPQHMVAVAGFFMAKFELTKRQWYAVMQTEPWLGHLNVTTDPDSPAVYLSWNDAQDFVAAINDSVDPPFHLPHEAQWEYACRANTTMRFYWGDDTSYGDTGTYAWFSGDTASDRYAHKVGTAGGTGHPNAFGLYDMSGNIWELCEDDFHWTYQGAPSDARAWMDAPRAAYRVLRGGSWYDSGSYLRSANRDLTLTDFVNFNHGMRLAK